MEKKIEYSPVDYLYFIVVRKVGSTPEIREAYEKAKQMEEERYESNN